MKNLLLKIIFPVLFFLSFSAFADKIIISGKPVAITQSGTVYMVPTTSTYTTSSDYYYVTMGNEQRVCYREAQPSLASIGLMDISLRIGSDTVAVHCYTYSPDYFTVQ